MADKQLTNSQILIKECVAQSFRTLTNMMTKLLFLSTFLHHRY